MKQRMLNVLKWPLIAFGVLFFIQLLIVAGVIIGVNKFSNLDVEKTMTTTISSGSIKDIQPIIDYIEDYKKKNNKYPEKIDEVKIKPYIYFNYEVIDNGNCYKITANSKKDNKTKEFQRCKIENENSASSSQSYVEYIK